jgi:hypothetical protein
MLVIDKSGEVGMPTDDANSELKRFVFSNLTTMIIAEGQLVWMRYNAMLTANAIVAAVLGAVALKTEITRKDEWLLLLASIFGVALSSQWRKLTTRGWEVQKSYISEARNYHWPDHKNAFEVYGEWRERTRRSQKKTDGIEIHAQRVIKLFILAYVLIALYAGSRMFGPDWTILERALAVASRLFSH